MTDVLSLPYGLPVILNLRRTNCQAVDLDSQWMEAEGGDVPSVLYQFLMNSMQFHMDLGQIHSDSPLDSQ